MTRRDWNRPSIVIQTLINEAWGIDMKQADQRAGLLKWFDEARPALQPLGRLLVDNSPCCENFHLKSDIDDYHHILDPGQRRAVGQMGRGLCDAAGVGVSAHGDAVRTKREPLVVSEFGNWGLPELPAELPWWFARDFDGRAITRPAGLFDRFHGLGFDRVFGDYKTLARETQWRQFYSLKHEIESMRRHASIQGYVITEFTDINWEVNGLMDMWRRPKIYAERLAAIQQDDVLLPSSPARNVASGAAVELDVQLSRYSATIQRVVRSAGRRRPGSAESARSARRLRGGVGQLGSVGLIAPRVDRATLEQVTLELKSAGGTVLARNTHDLFVYPATPPAPEGIVVHDPNALLGHLPWHDAATLTPGATVVSSVFDAEVRAHVDSGGTAVVVASKVLFGVVEAPGLNVVERGGARRQLGDQLHVAPYRQPAVFRTWTDARHRL